MKVRKPDKEVADLLSKILKVQGMLVTKDMSITDGARLLKKLVGLDNQTIAEILNTSAATVRTLTANSRSDRRVGRVRARRKR